MTEINRKTTKEVLREVAADVAEKALPILEEAAKNILAHSKVLVEEKLEKVRTKSKKG